MRRRIVVTVSAVVVVALGLGAVIWFWAVPHWRPALEDGERYGIDVSAHQDEIDWAAVADDGIQFAYIKASEGEGWVDEWFEENWAGAAAAGLDRGAYHFFTLCAPGEAQAENFLSVAPPDADALPPVIDLELTGNCSERPPADQVAAEVDAFVELVEQAWDRDLLFYVRPDWDDVYPVRDGLDRRLWDYRFFRRPTDERWHVWQVSTFARVDGIDGPVDLDIMRNGGLGSEPPTLGRRTSPLPPMRTMIMALLLLPWRHKARHDHGSHRCGRAQLDGSRRRR